MECHLPPKASAELPAWTRRFCTAPAAVETSKRTIPKGMYHQICICRHIALVVGKRVNRGTMELELSRRRHGRMHTARPTWKFMVVLNHMRDKTWTTAAAAPETPPPKAREPALIDSATTASAGSTVDTIRHEVLVVLDVRTALSSFCDDPCDGWCESILDFHTPHKAGRTTNCASSKLHLPHTHAHTDTHHVV